MSRRKSNLNWDSAGFIKRLNDIAKPNPYAFAKAAGLSDQKFRKYLVGTIPGSDALSQIARTAKVSMDWLVDGKEYKTDGCCLQSNFSCFFC